MMMNDLIQLLTLVCALACGLIAGVFFAFSTFVMKALARLPANEGIAAMQSINIVVINPAFLGVFLGAALVCVVLMVCAVIGWQRPGAAYLLAGSLFYLVGTILVTMVFNVPKNDALAVVNPTSAEGGTVWASYLISWTSWNHVRTVAAFAAAALFTLALRRRIF